MQNTDIRAEIKAAGVKQWQVADALKMPEATLSRKLRYELTPEDKKRVRAAIAYVSEVQ